MRPESLIKTIQLDVSLDKADGELFYCIRQLNPKQRSWGRSEPASNKVLYNLSHLDTDAIGAGSAGSLLIWSAEDRTYLEITPPPQPTEREGVDYLMAIWFRQRGRWPESSDRMPVDLLRLVEKILDGLSSEHQEITFSQPIGVDILQQCCQGIMWVLRTALGEMPAPATATPNQQLISMLEQAIYSWARGRSQTMLSDSSPAQAFWRKLAGWLADDGKPPSVQTLQKVSLPKEDQFGLGMIRSLLAACVERTYQKRLDYQRRVLTMFMERLALPAPALMDAALAGNAPANVLKAGSSLSPIPETETKPHTALPVASPLHDPFEVIPDINDHRLISRLWQEGFNSCEIGEKIGKDQLTAKTVYNLISKWRKGYPELKLRRRR